MAHNKRQQLTIFNLPQHLFVFGIISLTLFGGFFWIMLVRAPFEAALNARGMTTTATVTYVSPPYRRRLRSRGRSQDVTYEFFDQSGIIYQDVITRSRSGNTSVQPGREFELIYLPEAPHRHHSDLHPQGSIQQTLILTFIFFTITTVMSVFWFQKLPNNWAGVRLFPPFSYRLKLKATSSKR
ncbi:MAG: DUF3592 domain-containing protein [Cyanobacteria bacterium P01_E01_bin.6]